MSSENLTIIANSEEGSGGHEPRTVAAFAKKKQSLSSNLQETCSPANTLILAQDRQVIVETSDKTWSPGEGNGKPLQHSCFENLINSMKMEKDMTLNDEFPRSVGAQYATGEEQRNSSRRNEEAEPKWKQLPVVDVSRGESKVRCCKEQYCIGTWNVRSMNQGKLEVVKQETARVNIDILGIREPKWTGMGEFNSDFGLVILISDTLISRTVK